LVIYGHWTNAICCNCNPALNTLLRVKWAWHVDIPLLSVHGGKLSQSDGPHLKQDRVRCNNPHLWLAHYQLCPCPRKRGLPEVTMSGLPRSDQAQMASLSFPGTKPGGKDRSGM
jgi:hypothetical protein